MFAMNTDEYFGAYGGILSPLLMSEIMRKWTCPSLACACLYYLASSKTNCKKDHSNQAVFISFCVLFLRKKSKLVMSKINNHLFLGLYICFPILSSVITVNAGRESGNPSYQAYWASGEKSDPDIFNPFYMCLSDRLDEPFHQCVKDLVKLYQQKPVKFNPFNRGYTKRTADSAESAQFNPFHRGFNKKSPDSEELVFNPFLRDYSKRSIEYTKEFKVSTFHV